MDVDYRQFTKLFEYITNLEKRFDCPFTLIMIELDTTSGEEPQMEELEDAMYYLDRAIRQTIRNVDVVTRYSRQQYLVIRGEAGLPMLAEAAFYKQLATAMAEIYQTAGVNSLGKQRGYRGFKLV